MTGMGGRTGRAGIVLCLVAVSCLSPAGAVPTGFAPNPNVGWIAVSALFIPPPSGPGPVRQDPSRPRITNEEYRATGRQPTLALPDLSNPILQPWVREQMRRRSEEIVAGKTILNPSASCMPVGVPDFLLHAVPPIFFVQGPREVVMILQADHQVRHVYLNVPHSAHIVPSWYGESVGRYEDDTLIVDTIGIDTSTVIDGYHTPHTQKLHVIERFRVVDNGMVLEALLHIEDEGAFTTPWNASQRFRRVEPGVAENPAPINALSSARAAGPLMEEACAENPSSYFGNDVLPVPQAEKPDF